MIKLNTPLKADEIDFRIQSINKKGIAIIVPYKNARVDMNRLDAVYGAEYWQRKHHVIDGNLYCSIGIYNKEIKEWVWKEDVGVESFVEKEKGESSDSFKRACVNAGIGRELYFYPTIIIQLKSEEFNIYGDKVKQTYRLNLDKWKWYNQFNDKDELTFLMARDESGEVRYKFGTYSKELDASSVEETKTDISDYETKIKEAKTIEELRKYYEIVKENGDSKLRKLYSAREIQLK